MPEPLNVCFSARWTTPSCSSVIRISRNPPKCLRCREIWTCFSFSEISAAVSVKWRRQFHSLKKTSCEEFNSSNSFQNKHTLKKLYFWSLSKVFQMISFRFFSSSSSSLRFFFWQTTGCCFQFMSTSLCWSTTCNVATTATLRPNFVVRSLKFVWLVWILHFCNFDPLWVTVTQS